MDNIIGEDFAGVAIRDELKSLTRQKSMLTSRLSAVNQYLEGRRQEMAKYKKALAQERALKESVIGKLVRMGNSSTESSENIADFPSITESVCDSEKQCLKIEYELADEELQVVDQRLNVLHEKENKMQESDKRLAALQEEIRQLEIKIDDQKTIMAQLEMNLKGGKNSSYKLEPRASFRNALTHWKEKINKHKM